MKRSLGAILDLLMCRGPLPWLGRRWNRNRLVVLAYHGVDDRSSFAAHLDQLMRLYHVVSLDQVLSSIESGGLPPNSVLITFDDGERTVLTDGLPELQKRSLPSVLFAIAGLIDTEEPFWWWEVEDLVGRGATSSTLGNVDGVDAILAAMKEMRDVDRLASLAELRASAGGDHVRQVQLTADELRYLDANGMDVENHSLTHPLLDMCSETKIDHEVGAAADILEKILGRPVRAFAYPNGNADDRVTSAVRQRGTKAAFAFNHRSDKWVSNDLMLISRVRVNSTSTQRRFAAIVSGVHPAIHALRGRS